MGEELQAQLLPGEKHAGWSLLQKSWLALKKKWCLAVTAVAESDKA